MRIIVVEDEPRIREGIVHIIKNHTHYQVIAVFDSAEDALPVILEHQPDLVITDIKMKEMDGLSLLDAIEKSDVSCEYIILTGYADFDYARRAVHLHVSDYLLKPIMIDDILDSLKRVERKITEYVKIDDGENLTLEQSLALTLTTTDNCHINKLKKVFGNRFDIHAENEHSIILFQLKSVDSESYRWAFNQIQEKKDMLCLENSIVFDLPSEQSLFLLSLHSGRNQGLEKLVEKHILSCILVEIQCVCVSCRFIGLSEMKKNYELCKELLDFSLLFPEGEIITNEWANEFHAKKLVYPTELEDRLKLSVLSRNYQSLQEIVGVLHDWVHAKVYKPDEIKSVLSRLLCVICAAAESQEPELNGYFNYNELVVRVNSSVFEDDLHLYLKEIFDVLIHEESRAEEKSGNLLVVKAMAAIKENYMLNLSLSLVAEELHITPEYLSGLFRKEMGVNFTTFLRNFRISHAKRLLRKPDVKIQSVAAEVGFRDPKYFNRIFKEVCGISPSSYRNRLLKKPAEDSVKIKDFHTEI